MDMNEKVSIIMPAYNCERFIETAIESVQNQTYSNWELIITEDCSTDNTFEILKGVASRDKRVIILKNERNEGAAASRNRSIEKATGRFIAFLDSDDVWNPQKLEKQLFFMQENQFDFTCTSYDKIDENGESKNVVIQSYTVDYDGLLKHCPGNSTVIYDQERLGKFYVPIIRKRNDYVLWLQVIKKAKMMYGLDCVLGSHRVGMKSISSNKFSLLKYHWIVYRNIEKLTLYRSLSLCLYWVCKRVFRIKG